MHNSGCRNRVFPNATSMTDVLNDLGRGACNSIINNIDEVKRHACSLAADQIMNTWIFSNCNVYQKL